MEVGKIAVSPLDEVLDFPFPLNAQYEFLFGEYVQSDTELVCHMR